MGDEGPDISRVDLVRWSEMCDTVIDGVHFVLCVVIEEELSELCRQCVTVLYPHLVSVESAIGRWEASPMPALGTFMARLAGVLCRCRNRRSAYTGGWLVAAVWTAIFP